MYTTNLNVFEEKKRALKAGDEKVLQQIGQGRDIVSVLRTCFPCAIRIIIYLFLCFTVKGMEEADEEDRLTDAEVLAQLTYVSLIPSINP